LFAPLGCADESNTTEWRMGSQLEFNDTVELKIPISLEKAGVPTRNASVRARWPRLRPADEQVADRAVAAVGSSSATSTGFSEVCFARVSGREQGPFSNIYRRSASHPSRDKTDVFILKSATGAHGRDHFGKRATLPKFTPLTSGNVISASEMMRAP